MTHYNISYAALEPEEAHKKALADIREYLGKRKFDELSLELRAHFSKPPEEDHFLMWVSIAGVQGFQARAWYKELFAPESTSP